MVKVRAGVWLGLGPLKSKMILITPLITLLFFLWLYALKKLEQFYKNKSIGFCELLRTIEKKTNPIPASQIFQIRTKNTSKTGFII